MSIIQDGTGRSYAAKVSSDQRLLTESKTITIGSVAAEAGDGFNLNTGDITLTADSDTAVAYFKYTGTRTFVLASIAVGLGTAQGTVSNPAKITLVKDPTTGNIISDATAGDMNANRNFASTNTLSANFYKGAAGKTFGDGTDLAQFYAGAGSRLFASIDFDLGPNNAIGINIEPNCVSGFITYAAFIGYEKTLEADL